jgi:acyl-CoA thioester hydrolase
MPDPHLHRLRVYIEDTDTGGIVYYANYLKFAERARTEMLRDAGLSHAQMIKRDHLFLAVKKCEVDYVRPALLDDRLTIHTIITDMTGVRLKMDQRIHRNDDPIAQVKTEIVCINPQGKPMRFPKALMQTLLSYQPTKKVYNASSTCS